MFDIFGVGFGVLRVLCRLGLSWKSFGDVLAVFQSFVHELWFGCGFLNFWSCNVCYGLVVLVFGRV